MREWHRYYSAKRIGQQWQQLDLVGRFHRGGEILEIGPYLGLVTACLSNAGYEVTTLDLAERQFRAPDTEHIVADIRTLDPRTIAGFDTVLCCEMLEHLPWRQTDDVLRALAQSGRTLIVSVPYEGWQVFAQLYANRYTARQMFQWRKLRAFRRFPVRSDAPEAHQWEVGYRGHSLTSWEQKFAAAGWTILHREFTAPTRSVFHVLRVL
jgi:cyclopropane fatty-acyl-phospholipid synthase-like methyltransferase